MIQLAGSVLIILCAVLATASPLVYGLFHKWWRFPGGRHVFSYMAVLAASLDLWAIRLVTGDSTWFLILRLAAFALLPWVLAWRLLVIIRALHTERAHRNGGDPRE